MKAAALCLIPVALYFLAGLAIQVAWNMCMPDLFDLPKATYFNGVGLALLFTGWKSFPSLEPKSCH